MQKSRITEILHHLGEEDLPYQAINPAIFQTSNFSFSSFDEFHSSLLDETHHYLYTRGNNPTVNLVEQKIAALEHGEQAKLVSAGVAAISEAILAFIKTGDHIISVRDCYSWTSTLLSSYLERFNIQVTYIEGINPEEISQAIKPNTALIYLESPTTMTFKLQPLALIAQIARAHHIKTIIDNTWATPLYQNPLDLGLDLVVHSASKYLGGHSDLVAGIIVGSQSDIQHIFKTEFLQHGAVPDPFMAWLLLRGLRTLHVRVPVHYKQALEIAQFLENHPKVQSVNYPFLPSYSQYSLARQQMRGGTGLFSFLLKCKDLDRIKKFYNSFSVFTRAVSWGGWESLVFAHAIGVKNPTTSDKINLIRIHVGLEEVEILKEDLAHALAEI